ncbi:MAG TPA: proline racemase family protein [Pirellulales bacterium]|jgi:proline racemase|nr:proline racemase family protein [Pirellulales bacterium]
MQRIIRVIDSHTAGEPTRVVIEGGPDLGAGAVADRLDVFREEHDRFRTAIINEPRGSDVLVGAVLCAPVDAASAAGVIFFNNVGTLGMCGHGLIGVVRTLAHLDRIQPGPHRIETPVGDVSATLHPDQSVSVINVPSFRKARGVTIEVEGVGRIVGDVAWGGNWFFLVKSFGTRLALAEVERLIDVTWRIRQAINAAGFPEVDHVELFGPAESADANARNFVLCPGKAYDRSPCGTGTSAKLACLAADGELMPGETWTQESILGTRFTGSFTWDDRSAGRVIPTISGTAFITADCRLLLDEDDPFCWGIPRPNGQ